MALRTHSAEELPSVNLTPMIDVVFLLIIFFMVGTQFTEQERQIELNLPEAGQLQAMMTPPERKEVAVTAEGAVLLDGNSITLESLTAELKKMRDRFPGLRVVVRADGQAQHQYVAAVYGAVNRAGIGDLAIAVRYESPTIR